MTRALRLVISTPTQLLIDETGVVALRGEDASGAFGILPGHANFVTALVPCVLRWRRGDRLRFCAVRGGVLSVAGGAELRVACHVGEIGDELETLEAKARAATVVHVDSESKARVEQLRLHAFAVRQLARYLRPSGLSDPLTSEAEAE
jgi:F-type H+-transporting ATPase subunit epsilon